MSAPRERKFRANHSEYVSGRVVRCHGLPLSCVLYQPKHQHPRQAADGEECCGPEAWCPRPEQPIRDRHGADDAGEVAREHGPADQQARRQRHPRTRPIVARREARGAEQQGAAERVREVRGAVEQEEGRDRHQHRGGDSHARVVQPRAEVPHQRERERSEHRVHEPRGNAEAERSRERERPADREAPEHPPGLLDQVVEREDPGRLERRIPQPAGRHGPRLIEVDVLVARVREVEQDESIDEGQRQHHQRRSRCQDRATVLIGPIRGRDPPKVEAVQQGCHRLVRRMRIL